MKDRRLAAIIFTDIVGYTALMGKDEKKAHEMIHTNRKIQLSLIHHYKGTCLKEMGDGIMASFPSAINAVLCATKIQQFVQKDEIPLRIGIHQGDVIFENNDVLGDGVNLASRIEQATKPGCISISETVYKEIKNKPEIEAEFLDEMVLKNVAEPVNVYKVLFDEKTDLDYGLIKDLIPGKFKWKGLYAFLALLVVMVFVLLVYLPKLINKPTKDIERSIAVLPFDNESTDESNIYFVNGMMEDIRNNLAKIGDLRVISKTSTEKYRERASTLTVQDIANELEVSYLLEGTVQKQGDQVKIHAQLIQADTDDHVWSETYVKDLIDVFSVQSEIALVIAGELYAVITPEELEIIEKIPTKNISSYDIYLQAREKHNYFLQDYRNSNALDEAIILYRRALEQDSTFSRAYTGLARAYYNKHYWEKYFEETFQDTLLVLAEKALSYDDQLDEAYFVRGQYYASKKGGLDKSLKDFKTALKLNPNYVQVYHMLSIINAWIHDDYVEAIKNRRMAINLDKSSSLPNSIRNLADLYSNIGLPDSAIKYYEYALLLDNDSVDHYNRLSWMYFGKRELKTAYNLVKKAYQLDTTNLGAVMRLMMFCSFLGYDLEANTYALKLVEIFDNFHTATPNDWHRIGYSFWKVGNFDKANYYFNEQIKWCRESIRLNKSYAAFFGSHYDLACVLILKGQIDEGFQLLDQVNSKRFLPAWWVASFEYEPFFTSIRNDPRFQEILLDIKSKYQKEHDRVKAWMEEEDQLGS